MEVKLNQTKLEILDGLKTSIETFKNLKKKAFHSAYIIVLESDDQMVLGQGYNGESGLGFRYQRTNSLEGAKFVTRSYDIPKNSPNEIKLLPVREYYQNRIDELENCIHFLLN